MKKFHAVAVGLVTSTDAGVTISEGHARKGTR